MDNIVAVEHVVVEFPFQENPLRRLLAGQHLAIHALNDVSLGIQRGEIFGLVGESGSGKTTLGRVIVGLLKPKMGRVMFEGSDIARLKERSKRPLRRRFQIIYQDPHASLNPAMTIGAAIAHPLVIHGLARNEKEAHPRVLLAMEEVGLFPSEELYFKYPAELSGGQKQRVAIARAMILKPSLIVADEPVAMLDMSVRAHILELMLELKRKYDLTYLFITHDLATAKFLCDRLAIMYLGRIVEKGDAKSIYADPKHPYTKSLLAAVPIPDPKQKGPKKLPPGEVPDAVLPPSNCHFHPRCPAAVWGCGWEPRDFLQFLDQRRTGLTGEALDRDLSLLGEFPRAEKDVHGLTLKPEKGKTLEVLGYVEHIISSGAGPMFEAISSVRSEGGNVQIEFRPWIPLREVTIDERRVLCILQQSEWKTATDLA